jgi:spermidine synthase
MLDNIYPDVKKYLKEKTIGDYSIDFFEVNHKTSFRAIIDGISEGKYVRLLYKNEVVMSDTNMEKRTNYDFVSKAHGDVLIGGLGIGMIVMAIQDKKEVKSITIIEKSKEVIDLVKPNLPFNNKVKIIQEDIFSFKTKEKYDCIYLDIWNWVNSSIYKEEMKPLKAKYRKYLKPKEENPNRYLKCWAEYQAKHNLYLY